MQGRRAAAPLATRALLLLSLAALHSAAAFDDAPPSSPVGRIDTRQKYLLYDVIFHEQVNKQRRALMFYLDLAMKLKRTLVLPRTRLLKRLPGQRAQFAPEADFVRWGDLYNLTTLSKLHSVIELEDFVAERGASATTMVLLKHHNCQASAAPTKAAFNGLPNGGLQVANTLCEPGVQYKQSELLSARFKHKDVLAFSDSVDQLALQPSLRLRPWVRFEQGAYDAAAAFVNERFGGEPFVALHWRRTDFLHARATQAGVLQPPGALVRHAKALMRKHGAKHVYLATDCDDPRELRQVQDGLSPHRYEPPGRGGALVDKTVVANVEIAICAMAAGFLGTRSSSFTLAISEEREAIFGHQRGTGGDMDELPPPAQRGAKDEL